MKNAVAANTSEGTNLMSELDRFEAEIIASRMDENNFKVSDVPLFSFQIPIKKTAFQIVYEWLEYPVHEISDDLESLAPCKYMNRSLAVYCIWEYLENRNHIIGDKIYGLPIVSNGTSTYHFIGYLNSQITQVHKIPLDENLKMMGCYYNLAYKIQHKSFDTRDCDSSESENLMDLLSSD
eukprot:NODE_129_length_16972_cov_2.172643.p13 type:complete len:180 gc:universal NODE_129_length_16972_cov_2.172643:2820-3359(+)